MTYSPAPNRPLMAALGVVNRWAILRGHFQLRDIDLPADDRARLQRGVNPGTAAFMAPNHPEFGLDWMIDKELSTMVAPRMAAWASHSILATAPWFWSRNNLVSNKGGADARDYSVEWALRGHGVLLHPEGTVRWTSDIVHPLYRGIAALAVEAARRSAAGDNRPVYIVPVIWKLRYTRDVSAGIHAEMDVIERALGLRSGAGKCVADRFRALYDHGPSEFPREWYNRLSLTQEHIHECLKRLRAEHLTSEPSHKLHNMLPRPYGPRVVHVRVPEPIRIDSERAAAEPDAHGPYVELLLEQTRAAMQAALDQVNLEIAPELERFAHANPLVESRAGAGFAGAPNFGHGIHRMHRIH